MSIKGTRKNSIDRVNEPVLKWGFTSLTLVFIVFIMLLVAMILFFAVNKIIALLFIIGYIYGILRVSKWNLENQKKGLSNPMADKLEYMSIDKYYEQNLDHKSIYNSKTNL